MLGGEDGGSDGNGEGEGCGAGDGDGDSCGAGGAVNGKGCVGSVGADCCSLLSAACSIGHGGGGAAAGTAGAEPSAVRPIRALRAFLFGGADSFEEATHATGLVIWMDPPLATMGRGLLETVIGLPPGVGVTL